MTWINCSRKLEILTSILIWCILSEVSCTGLKSANNNRSDALELKDIHHQQQPNMSTDTSHHHREESEYLAYSLS